MSRSDWVRDDVLKHILAALMPENRLAIITSIVTGLRIGDVLSIRTAQVQRGQFTVTEQKTLKRRRVRLPVKLCAELLRIAGRVYVFEGRLSALRPRTRQAVYKDIKRAARLFRVPENITPHTARKVYAVAEYRHDMDIRRVQRLLNHSNEAVTLIYTMADAITEKRLKRHKRRAQKKPQE